jgi:hypothetical protein
VCCLYANVSVGVVVDGNEHLPAFGDEQQRVALKGAEEEWAEDLAKYSTGLVGADENGFERLNALPEAAADAAPEPSAQ